jgi:hypothetical protein
MSDVSQTGSEFVRDLGEAARNHPVSAALIGMGILWLFTGGKSVERAGEFVRRTGVDRIPDATGNALAATRSTLRNSADLIADGVSSARETLRDGSAVALDRAADIARQSADTASDYTGAVPEYAADVFYSVRSNLTELFRAQPLALGAIGLAIGAGIAAALPPTAVESDLLGESSNTVKEKATEFAAEQVDQVTAIAGDVVGAVSEEARRQGLTAEAAKSAAKEISEKVGRVVMQQGKTTKSA